MADGSGIEWTDATWNPTVGCTKVSPGCDHCYAEIFVNRFAGSKGFPLPFDEMLLRGDRFLNLPLTWRDPRKVFVNSLSDLFHADVPDDFIARVFAVMAAAQQHTFQLLTKRHGRMGAFLRDECKCGSGHPPGVHLRSKIAWAVSRANPNRVPGDFDEAALREVGWPLPNVWLGVSVEDQQWADNRIPALLNTPAAVRWISAEPLLGPVDVTPWLHMTPGVDWVVVGGESGAGSRPMLRGWARHLRDQCEGAGVPFLFKQWGSHDEHGRPISKKIAGRVLDGETHDGYPLSSTEKRSPAGAMSSIAQPRPDGAGSTSSLSVAPTDTASAAKGQVQP